MQKSFYGIMAKILDCGLEASELEFQLCYYINFLTNTFGKGINLLILPSMG